SDNTSDSTSSSSDSSTSDDTSTSTVNGSTTGEDGTYITTDDGKVYDITEHVKWVNGIGYYILTDGSMIPLSDLIGLKITEEDGKSYIIIGENRLDLNETTNYTNNTTKKESLKLGKGEKSYIKDKVVFKSISVNNKKVTVKKKSKGYLIKAKKKGKSKVYVNYPDGSRRIFNITIKKAPKKIKAKKKVKVINHTWKKVKIGFNKGAYSNKLTYKIKGKSARLKLKKSRVCWIKAIRKGESVLTVKTFNGKKKKIKILVKN
nr:hypothetical protein [Lachnospiraceae bacterium]